MTHTELAVEERTAGDGGGKRGGKALTEGARAERNFDLTAAIYKLDVFKVTGEREGDASALTLQRNSENLKNIVAMDSFGNLPNMSVGEVVMRLPGMAGSPTDEGLNYGFNTRGTGRGRIPSRLTAS